MFLVKGIAYIYWPIDYTPNIGFVHCSQLKELPTIIGQLTTLQILYLFHYS
jgi:hypothetical protein